MQRVIIERARQNDWLVLLSFHLFRPLKAVADRCVTLVSCLTEVKLAKTVLLTCTFLRAIEIEKISIVDGSDAPVIGLWIDFYVPD